MADTTTASAPVHPTDPAPIAPQTARDRDLAIVAELDDMSERLDAIATGLFGGSLTRNLVIEARDAVRVSANKIARSHRQPVRDPR